MVTKDLLNKIYQMEKDLKQIRLELLQQYELENPEKNYCVYYHLFPNGKYYIGMSKNTEKRWLKGWGYRSNKEMNTDIKKYGWENIKHRIICKTITQVQAEAIEKFLISFYKSAVSEYGYNKYSFLPKNPSEDWRKEYKKDIDKRIKSDYSEFNEEYLKELEEAYQQKQR